MTLSVLSGKTAPQQSGHIRERLARLARGLKRAAARQPARDPKSGFPAPVLPVKLTAVLPASAAATGRMISGGLVFCATRKTLSGEFGYPSTGGKGRTNSVAYAAACGFDGPLRSRSDRRAILAIVFGIRRRDCGRSAILRRLLNARQGIQAGHRRKRPRGDVPTGNWDSMPAPCAVPVVSVKTREQRTAEP